MKGWEEERDRAADKKSDEYGPVAPEYFMGFTDGADWERCRVEQEISRLGSAVEDLTAEREFFIREAHGFRVALEEIAESGHGCSKCKSLMDIAEASLMDHIPDAGKKESGE